MKLKQNKQNKENRIRMKRERTYKIRHGLCVYPGCRNEAAKNRRSCKKHLQIVKEIIQKGYKKRKLSGLCVYGGCRRKAAKGQVQCSTHTQLARKRNIKREAALKIEVMSRYCDGRPHCQCLGCNVVFIGFLQIDHVYGGGNRHRTQSGKSPMRGVKLLTWIKNNDYPKEFQVLCANCNSPGGKGTRKYCPLRNKSHSDISIHEL